MSSHPVPAYYSIAHTHYTVCVKEFASLRPVTFVNLSLHINFLVYFFSVYSLNFFEFKNFVELFSTFFLANGCFIRLFRTHNVRDRIVRFLFNYIIGHFDFFILSFKIARIAIYYLIVKYRRLCRTLVLLIYI